MRIFIYEWVTGGGWFDAAVAGPPPPSLIREGSAMLAALTEDFSHCPGVEVVALRDARWPEIPLTPRHIEVATRDQASEAFCRACRNADRTIIIAPEFDGHLLAYCRRAESLGGNLLSPNSLLVALASDKHATCEHLRRQDVATPSGTSWPTADGSVPNSACSDGPWVVKPRDGAGSIDVRLVYTEEELRKTLATLTGKLRVEAYCPGHAVSVGFLCGPNGCIPLEPCRQRLSQEGCFEYFGGSLPLPASLRDRAIRLASHAVATLPGALGYLGIDLVLGPDETGENDVVVEINPRLTTSYVGLRAACTTNLAAAMLDVASGETVELRFTPTQINFTAAGQIEPSVSALEAQA